MDQTTGQLVVWTTITIFIAAVALLLFRGNHTKSLPPGPKPWPVVGNLAQLDPNLSHQGFAKLSSKYGPLIYLRLGSLPLIVAHSAKLAEEILKTQDLVFATRPRITAFKYLAYDNQTISTSPYGRLWRNVRKVLMMELLTSRRIREFQPIRKEELLTAIQALLEESNGEKAVRVDVTLKAHLGNVITRMMMRKCFFGPKAEDELDALKFQSTIKEIIDLLGVFHLGDYIPLFKHWDVQGNQKRMLAASANFDEFIQGILDERRENLKTRVGSGDPDLLERGDFLDVLLTRSAEQDEVPVTEAMKKGIIQESILGGVDSTANVVHWALAEVLKHPRVLEKAQEELDAVVGRERLVEESDIPQLHYLRAIIKEGFRLHPVTPLLLPRKAMIDCEVGGYHIPAGSQVFVNVWAIGRDPEVWKKPLEFSPERFLDSPVDVVGHDFELLPFGAGRRKCPGINFGLLLAQYTLAVLLQAFEWKLPDGQNAGDIDMTEGSGMVNHKATPVESIVRPRIPIDVIYFTRAAEADLS